MDNPTVTAPNQPGNQPGTGPQPGGERPGTGREPGKAQPGSARKSAIQEGLENDQKNLNKGKPGDGKQPPEGMTEAEKKIWKLNVFGKEVDFDATDEETVKKTIQRGLAADQRFQKAAQVEKQLHELVNRLRTAPEQILFNEKLGHNPEQLLERIIQAAGPKSRAVVERIMGKFIDEEMMDPKDRELLQHKRQVEEYEKKLKSVEEQKLQERQRVLTEHYNNEYTKDIVGALENSGLPKTPATFKRMCHYLHLGLQKGANLKASDVVAWVKEDYQNEIKELYGNLDGDILLSMLGPDTTQKMLAAATKSAKENKLKVPANEQPQGGEEPVRRKSKYISPDEWREKHGY